VLDPRQLQVLHEVARTGSYSAAARELGFSQPAISYQMRRLEQEVGARLTVRIGRSMKLTPAGTALLAHTERILAAVRAAENQLAELATGGAGTVRLAAFPSACATLLPTAMAAMRRSNPKVEVRLVQAEPPRARELVRRGAADVALGYHYPELPAPDLDPGESGPERQELLVEDIHLVLPMEHPAASHRLVEVDRLSDATFLVASARFEARLQALASAAGFTPRILTMVDDYVAMQALVAAGFGVALVPDLAMRAHRDPRIVTRTLAGWPRRHVRLVYWPDMLGVEPVRALVSSLDAAADAVRGRAS
jgi:DNA-binding transcriptional LysR family regulator